MPDYPLVDNMPDNQGGGIDDPMVQAVLRQALAEEYADGVADVARSVAEHRAGQARAAAQVDPAAVAAANQKVNATPVIRMLANGLGVYLANVAGTGAGGRITELDVRASADLRRPMAVAEVTGGRFPHPTAGTVDVRASYEGWLAAARAAGPEPTLFATGDLPPFTASGIDVAELMKVPWQARPAMAGAPTRAAALAIVQEVLSDPNPEVYARELFSRHDRVVDYLAEVSRWLSAGQDAKRMATAYTYPGRRLAGGGYST